MTNPQPPGNWSDPSGPSAQPANQDPSQVSGQPAGYQDPTYQPTYQDPATGAPYQDPGYQPNPGYQPDPGYQPGGQPMGPGGYPAPPGYPGAGYPPYGYPVVAAQQTNGLAIASMVVSIIAVLGLCGYGIGGFIGIVGALLGHSAKKKIRESGEGGDGMALAGIIMGWIATGIAVLATIVLAIVIVWAINSDPSSSTY